MSVYRLQGYYDGPAAGASDQIDFIVAGDDLTGQIENLTEVYDKRCAMLANDWKGLGFRVTRILDDEGLPVVRESQFVGRGRASSATGWDSAPTDTCVRVVCFGFKRKTRREMKLAGQPVTVSMDGNIFKDTTPSWQTAFNSWRDAILARPAGWLTAQAKTPQVVTGYTVSNVGVVTVTVAAALEDAPAQTQRFRVRLSGINGKSEINGEWTAVGYRPVAAPGTGFQFELVGQFGLIPYANGGTARVMTRVWNPIGIGAAAPASGAGATSISIFAIGKRQRGAPFAAGRGRSKARVRT